MGFAEDAAEPNDSCALVGVRILSPPKPEQSESESLQVRVEHAVGRLKSLYDATPGFWRSSSWGRMWSRPSEDCSSSRSQVAFIRPAIGRSKRSPRWAPSMSLQTFCAREDGSPIQWSAQAKRWLSARRLARSCQEWVYRLLSDVAARWRVTGVLVGLGSFHRKDSIEIF